MKRQSDAGYSGDGEVASLLDGLGRLRREKARNVVISRAGDGALACIGERVLEARAPTLSSLDHMALAIP